MKIIALISLSFLLSACGNNHNEIPYDPPNTSANPLSRNWTNQNFPLEIYVPTDIAQSSSLDNISYIQAILNAETAWNNAAGFDIFRFIFDDSSKTNTQWKCSESEILDTNLYGPDGCRSQFKSLYDNSFGIFGILSWENFLPGISNDVLAFTGSLTQSGQIIHADILFNFKTYKFSSVTETCPNGSNLNGCDIDFESVLTHELGHFLGLDHVTTSIDSQSVMLPTLGRGRAKRTLSNGDIQRLRSLYNIPNP